MIRSRILLDGMVGCFGDFELDDEAFDLGQGLVTFYINLLKSLLSKTKPKTQKREMRLGFNFLYILFIKLCSLS